MQIQVKIQNTLPGMDVFSLKWPSRNILILCYFKRLILEAAPFSADSLPKLKIDLVSLRTAASLPVLSTPLPAHPQTPRPTLALRWGRAGPLGTCLDAWRRPRLVSEGFCWAFRPMWSPRPRTGASVARGGWDFVGSPIRSSNSNFQAQVPT